MIICRVCECYVEEYVSWEGDRKPQTLVDWHPIDGNGEPCPGSMGPGK